MKSTFSEPILRTKLYKPVIKDSYVLRKSIIDRLEKSRHNPLILVIAPAGYGKSVTVSEWLDYSQACHCWLSLDEEFNDVRTFYLYLVHAIRTVFPDAFTELHDLIHGSEMPPLQVLKRYLINGLDDLSKEFIMVLDDYHAIKNGEIHDIMNGLFKNPPGKFQTVIIARRDPPLALSSLRSYGDINEIRMADLSFTREELKNLTDKNLNIQITDSQISLLQQKTEGWIIGLRMALMHIAKSKDIEKSIKELKINQAFFNQYLLEEVLGQQPEPIHKLFLISTLSDLFSMELLKVILEEKNQTTVYPNQDLFNQFISSTLFIIPLDEEGIWFRYHHYFHDFLSKQLEKEYTKEEILAFHKKASYFFEKISFYEQAIRHAVKSNDVTLVSQIFERHKPMLLNTDQFSRLEKWLQLLPSEFIEQQPQFLLTRAFLQDSKADYHAMQIDLSLAELLLANIPEDTTPGKQLWGEFHAIHAGLFFYTGDNAGALESSRKALKNLSDQSSYLRIFARAFGSLALQTLGKSDEAITTLKKDLINLHPAQSADRGRILALLSLVNAFEDNLPELLDTALQYRSICLENKLFVTFIMANYFISVVYYLRNELNEIHNFIDEIQDYRYVGRPFWTLNCWFTRALCLQAEGKLDELESLIQKARAYAGDYDIQQLQGFISAFEVELALHQNNTSAAWKLSKNANFEVYPPIYYFFIPQLTHIKLLMVSDEPDKILEAENRLQQLVDLGYSTHKRNLLNQALPLQALFYQKTGNGKKALKILSKALALAEPTGHIRNFLDLGAPMQEMIKALHRKKPDDVYLAKIDKAFKAEQLNLPSISPRESTAFPISAATGVTKINNREIQLLQLIAEGYQNKEIAEKLYLAPSTIKKSLYLLYQKLNVKNRTSAVSTAARMGLLKSSDKLD